VLCAGAAIASLSVEARCHDSLLQHHVPQLLHVMLSQGQTDEVSFAVRCCNNLLLATAHACSPLISAGVCTGLVDALPALHSTPHSSVTIECDLSALRALSQSNAKSVYDVPGAIAALKLIAESPMLRLADNSSVDIAIILSAVASLSDRAREEIGASGLIGTPIRECARAHEDFLSHSRSSPRPFSNSLALQVAQWSSLRCQGVGSGCFCQSYQQHHVHDCIQGGRRRRSLLLAVALSIAS
jgi:hypothetical protein